MNTLGSSPHCYEMSGENVVQDSMGPLGIFQQVSQSSHNTGLSEKRRLCPSDNCIDCEFV